MIASNRVGRRPPCFDPVPILLEEYRQLYALALFRLNVLDQRVPVIGATLTGVLASIAVLPAAVQPLLLIGLPISLIWFARTTINHARSFEDVLRRIDEIERAVNSRARAELLQFQSRHPSRGISVGGRTGTETVEAVLGASALILGGCLHLAEGTWTIGPPHSALYALFIGGIAVALIFMKRGLARYRYRKHDQP